MGLKRAENQVKILLQETIIALCRNTLNSYGEVNVEGLLGVTLDNEEIFLVSINEMFNNPGVGKKHKKNLKRSKEAEDASESESERSDGDEHGDAPRKRKKKRARKKKKKADQGSGGSGEESDSSSNQDDDHAHTETEANTTQEDTHTEPTAHEIRPEPSSKTPTADDHRHKKSENDEDGNHDEDSNDLEKIKIKEELEEDDDDEDLVFVKEEIGDSSFSHNQYSNYSSDGQMYMPPGGMHSGQGGLMQMPGQGGVSNQYSQDFMGDMSNMSNMSQGSDSQQQQMMGFSPGQQNMSFTGASPVAGPSSASDCPADQSALSEGDGRDYPCVLCGKSFRQRIHLKTHVRVHTGERPYSCLLCLKAFTQISNLHRHLRSIHSVTESLSDYINSAR